MYKYYKRNPTIIKSDVDSFCRSMEETEPFPVVTDVQVSRETDEIDKITYTAHITITTQENVEKGSDNRKQYEENLQKLIKPAQDLIESPEYKRYGLVVVETQQVWKSNVTIDDNNFVRFNCKAVFICKK